MFGIKIKDQFLQLYPGTVLSFELNSPLYFGDDVEVIEGRFMFSMTVPLKGLNTVLLKRPHLLDNAETFITNEPCAIIAGSELLRGQLSVVSATKTECTINATFGSLAPLKNVLLNELPLDVIDVSTLLPNLLDHAVATCQNPDAFDKYIFHPVYNPSFYEDPETSSYAKNTYQNLYRISPPSGRLGGMVLEDGSNLTPFVRLDYLLKKMIESQNFTFSNDFQTTRELKWITTYNSNSLVSWASILIGGNIVADTIDLRQHVSNAKASDYLKKIVRLFNLGLFVDNFDNHVELETAETVLNRNPKWNWTNKLLRGYKLAENDTYPIRLAYKKADDDIVPTHSTLTKSDTLPASGTETGLFFDPSVGIWRYQEGDDVQAIIARAVLNDAYNSAEKPENRFEYESDITPLPMARVFVPYDGTMWMPALKQRGRNVFNPPEENPKYPEHLMLFRGMTDFLPTSHPDYNAPSMATFHPLATTEAENILGVPIKVGWNTDLAFVGTNPYPPVDAAHTLNWSGDKGIFNKFWAAWYDKLANKRIVTAQLNLSVRDIRNFKFQDKIRIKNQEYLVKKLKITLTKNGLQPTEAELVNVTA